MNDELDIAIADAIEIGMTIEDAIEIAADLDGEDGDPANSATGTATDSDAAPRGPEVMVARPASLPDPASPLVVVEASAGTGKTFFLEHRVVDLILAGAELGQILLVTFTDKAVAELRLRIRDLLDRLSRATVSTATAGEAPWRLDDDARRRLRAAVTAFDHAPIYTIHGFCHRLLIEDAFSARRLFEQTQVADEVAFDGAFSALLRERFAYRSPDRELLAAFLESRTSSGSARTVEALRSLLLGCVRAGAPLRRLLEPEAAHAAVEALRKAFSSEANCAAVAAYDKRWTVAWVEKIHEVLASTPETASAAHKLGAIDQLRDAAEKIAARITKGKYPADVAAAVRGIATTQSLDEAIAAQMLPPIVERMAEDKAEHGQFDYDDMLALVWAALTGPRRHELAARLRERTPWAMIDEFQDTDPVQWNIFRTVWMHPDARGLTIVGDPKQAIYSFRGADVDTYIAARDEMLRAGATRVVLDVNRRSTEPLVEAINGILIGTLGLPLLSGTITYDDPVRASGDVVCDDHRPPIQVFQLRPTSGKPSAEANRAALAAAIGDAIEALRRAPPPWTSRGVAKPFALDQVMVLTRANRESAEIAAALRARGLPCALVEPERLFKTREAAELASVLAAIAAPRDRSARLRALRTRFFDVPWDELMRVVDAPDHHPLIARLFDWAQLASRRAYESLFRRLVEDSRFAERALVLGGGERALTNTWHLIELLLIAVSRARCDLHELVGQLRRWIADDTNHPDERDVQRAETDADAIRVLTIHKAKGLEAPYVFLFGGTSAGPKGLVHTLRDAAGRALFVGKADAELQERLDREADFEHQRLAYVALTRAQVRLYVPSYAELNGTAMYQPIQRCLAPWIGPRPPSQRALFEVTPVPVGGPGVPDAPSDALAAFVAPPPPPPAELAPLPALRGGLAMLSYTRLAHDEQVAAVPVRPGDALALDPAEFDVDDTAGEVGPDELPVGPASGLMLHDVLENADLELARSAVDAESWAREPEVAAQLADAARGRGVAPRFIPHAAAIAYRTLTAPMPLSDGGVLPSMADATALAREVEFGYPIPTLTPSSAPVRGLVKGFIDALIAYDDELWVLDYKSDLLVGEDIGAAALRRVRERYAVQVRLYALAAERMRGRRRLAGLLYGFIRHDITVAVRVTDDSLAEWRHWLAQVGNLDVRGAPPTGGAAEWQRGVVAQLGERPAPSEVAP